MNIEIHPDIMELVRNMSDDDMEQHLYELSSDKVLWSALVKYILARISMLQPELLTQNACFPEGQHKITLAQGHIMGLSDVIDAARLTQERRKKKTQKKIKEEIEINNNEEQLDNA